MQDHLSPRSPASDPLKTHKSRPQSSSFQTILIPASPPHQFTITSNTHFLDSFSCTLIPSTMPPQIPQSTRPKTKKPLIPWDCNGVNGGESSIEIVLEWLATGTNYELWQGDGERGRTKTRLCSEIFQMMNLRGITHRDTKVTSFHYFSYSLFIYNV
ncbi:hypothetical protein PtB15_8B267 [Puccinia triticina]|nr:hypothetical protein PtB15_8B267 [Puccinia triticina]